MYHQKSGIQLAELVENNPNARKDLANRIKKRGVPLRDDYVMIFGQIGNQIACVISQPNKKTTKEPKQRKNQENKKNQEKKNKRSREPEEKHELLFSIKKQKRSWEHEPLFSAKKQKSSEHSEKTGQTNITRCEFDSKKYEVVGVLEFENKNNMYKAYVENMKSVYFPNWNAFNRAYIKTKKFTIYRDINKMNLFWIMIEIENIRIILEKLKEIDIQSIETRGTLIPCKYECEKNLQEQILKVAGRIKYLMSSSNSSRQPCPETNETILNVIESSIKYYENSFRNYLKLILTTSFNKLQIQQMQGIADITEACKMIKKHSPELFGNNA